jgi:ribonuclease P protein component
MGVTTMPATRLRYPPAARLGGKVAFAAVYDGKAKTTSGPLLFFARPNELAITRLGLSVSRKVGSAPHRNRIKRRIREAFRLNRPSLPVGYDLVVVVRPHRPLPSSDYRDRIRVSLDRLTAKWERREVNQLQVGTDARATEDPR